mgnify:CR=1 FL=1
MKNSFLDLIFQEDGSLQFLGELLVFNFRAVFLLAFCLLILRVIKMSASTRHVILATALISTALLPFYTKIFPSVDIVLETSKSNPSFLDKSMIQFFELADILSLEQEKNILTVSNHLEVKGREGLQSDIYLNSLELESFDYASVDWSLVLSAIYFSGIAFLLIKVLWSNFIVFLAVASAKRCSQSLWQKTVDKYCLSFWIRKPVEVRSSKAVMSPVTWGFFNPVILIPQDAINWSEELIKSTVLHELAHIKRADWLVKQIVRCICVIYWFNPYFWRVFRKMLSNLETAADDMALSAGLNKTSYASDLVSVVERLRQPRSLSFSAVGIVSVRSELGQRIEFILNPKNSHAQTSIHGFAFSVFIMFGVIVPLASFQPNFQQKIIDVNLFESALRGNEEGEGNSYSETRKSSTLSYANDEFLRIQNELLSREYSRILTGLSTREKNVRDSLVSGEKIVDLPAKSVVAITVEKIKQLKESQKNNRPDGNVVENEYIDSQIVSVQAVDSSLDVSNQIVKKSFDFVRTPSNTLEMNAKGEKIAPEGAVEFKNGNPSNEKRNLLVAFLKGADNDGDRSFTIRPRQIIKPRYPESARRRGIEGEVVVRYDVDSSGQIVNPVIVEANPKGVFDRSVIKALSRSSYYKPESNSESGFKSKSEADKGDVTTVGQVQELYKFVLDA